MKPKDKNYLRLQFRDKIYSKNGTEFQSFFEDVMQSAYPNFRKVPSGGGDGGNDGWIKELGLFFQVYAPNVPSIKDSEAANKMKHDFEKLKKNWNEVAEIKEYHFVFNDKYFGSKKPEEAISELEQENDSIKFDTFLAKDLENIFFKLDESEMLNLGFDIDNRHIFSIALSYLSNIQAELDRECIDLAQRILESSKEIVEVLKDESLNLEYEIMECKCLRKLERIDEAKEKLENIALRYPENPKALLILAEIFLLERNFDKNKELLERTKQIGKEHLLLRQQQLVRSLHLNEEIELQGIDEGTFSDDSIVKSVFYRIYSLFYERSGDKEKADSFIAKAIHHNPNRISNYIIRISISESRVFNNPDTSKIVQEAKSLLDDIEIIENQYLGLHGVCARSKAELKAKKLNALGVLEDYSQLETQAQEIFQLILKCYLDSQTVQILTAIVRTVNLPNQEQSRLIQFLINSKRKVPNELAQALIYQLIYKKQIFSISEDILKEILQPEYIKFVADLKSGNNEDVLQFLESDYIFAITIANSYKENPTLRKQIIENLPTDKDIQKERLLLLLNYDEKDFDEAFELLKKIDLSSLNYFECQPVLKIIRKKEAWDFEIIILEKFLEKENNDENRFFIGMSLLNAHINLKNYLKTIEIGINLLSLDNDKNYLDTRNKEGLLTNILIAYMERSTIEHSSITAAKEILEKYHHPIQSFEFKVGISAEVYLQNHEPDMALKSIIEGVKIKKSLSAEEYAKLHFILMFRIGNQANIQLDSLEIIEENSFIKLKNQNEWVFIGDENELDAVKISKTNDSYQYYIGQAAGSCIIIENRYGSNEKTEPIELIYSIDQYIFWQSLQNFKKLTNRNALNGVWMVETPMKGDTVDLKYLMKFMEDMDEEKEPLFEKYSKNHLPLAILAKSVGGLANAIGRIQREKKGFINFSSGTADELEKQKVNANTVIDKHQPFLLDGTSAVFLSEFGLFEKIFQILPNIIVGCIRISQNVAI